MAVALAILAMRQGSKVDSPASTTAANRRGDFIGVVGAQADTHFVPVSAGCVGLEKSLRSFGGAYVSSSIQLANAYALQD